MSEKDKFDVDRILSELFKPGVPERSSETLQEIFERRLSELQITRAAALEIMGVERLTLLGILQGSQKRVDFTNFIKLSQFLKISREQTIQLYLDALERNFPEIVAPSSVEFIKANFDLAALRRSGFIKSMTDFPAIEEKLISHFGLATIFDYQRPLIKPAFSADVIEPKSPGSRNFWISTAFDTCRLLNNPYEYDKKGLIEYFPKIRWHSTNVDLGLVSIIKDLYKLGITIIYQPTLSDLKLRGATFSLNNKPCIVLSNYRGFYATLWFSLLHELFHVIFDWDEIKDGKYHISEDGSDRLSVVQKEKEADEFAREYLLPRVKLDIIKPHIINNDYVTRFAYDNHMHPNIVYVFHAYDLSTSNRMAWARARKFNPDMNTLFKTIGSSWDDSKSISQFVKEKKFTLYI